MSDMVDILRGLGMDDIAEEIVRLRERLKVLEAQRDAHWLPAYYEGQRHGLKTDEALRARIVELEAIIATLRGTLSQTQTQGPEGFGVTFDANPTTPR